MSSSLSPDEIRKTTIGSYNKHFEEYLDKKAKLSSARTNAYWPGVEAFLSIIPEGSHIFEIGSGAGNDALEFEKRGFKVTRSDVTDSFVSYLQDEGHEVHVYDVLEGPAHDNFDAIFSNAVLLHFDNEMIRVALNNIHASLNPDGIASIGMKIGEHDGWRDQGLKGRRYFKFWEVDDFKNVLEDLNFNVEHTFVTPLEDFMFITVRKM